MAKIIDITDKLNFDEQPSLQIKDKIIEVNSDAPTMLKVMGLTSGEEMGNKEILEIFDLIFPEKSKKAITELKLSFKNLVVLVREAMALVTGESDTP